MNYLSHYYIDHQSGNHYYNTGLLLPDITKGMVQRFKASHPEIEGTNQKDLLKGCLRHYESDRLFHASDFFNEYLDHINRFVKNASLSDQVQRKWFIAHIITELMIDRVIVKAQRDMADQFYDSLSSINDDELVSFLKAFNAKDIPAFMTRFGHFRSVRYIYYYTDNIRFVYSLTRIMMRAGIPEPGEADKKRMAVLCNDIEREYFSDHNQVLSSLRRVFE